MGLIGEIVSALIAILKGFFGMDKPATEGVKNEKPETPVDCRSDDDLLDELGVHRIDGGAAGADGVCNCSSGQAVSSSGKQSVAGESAGRNE